MKKIRCDHKGFSIVEVLVAAGLLGGLALGVMQVSSIQNKSSRVSNQSFEMLLLKKNLSTLLRNTEICTSSFSPLGNVQTSKGLDRLIGIAGNEVFSTGAYNDNKLNNVVKINSIYTKQTNFPASIPSGETRMANLNIVVDALKKFKKDGDKNIKFIIPVMVKLNSSFNVVSCNHSSLDSINTARKVFCEDMGGTYDEASTPVCNILPAISRCTSNQALTYKSSGFACVNFPASTSTTTTTVVSAPPPAPTCSTNAGRGTCTEVICAAFSNNYSCGCPGIASSNWSFSGDAGSGPSCSNGSTVTGRRLSSQTGKLIGFSCTRTCP